MGWGFPRFDGRGLLINARAETAAERRTFRECVLHRRCVIPAKGFWEWNKFKEKFSLSGRILRSCSWRDATTALTGRTGS